ncbi:uncharacterized protein Tco025E_07305 [Trypanosoma conorhini]|uniref:CCHC-type domain-containing protein n=1 Tax=Trypanosoma conorhini TaxID=83891 RepID=A0A3R7MTF7_9TRYP|nr:uncharacterized protein Tco025E_07305 [Trypanosoma conorhini]RNF07854.1 hypothetical protein Tco025E_07305 [Trypanosoma conorhini]
MSRRCFMVYPLPAVADESFLSVVFDGGVRRSVFAGFGPRRFALVELQDDARAEAVACALRPAPPPHTSSGATADAAEDCTLGELFRAHIEEAGGGAPEAGATPSCIAHLARLRFRGTPICVLPSPIALEELYSCGGKLPRHRPMKRTDTDGPQESAGGRQLPQKQQRTPAEGRAAPSGEHAAESEPRSTPPRKRAARHVFPADCCQKCGSTDHFTRHCDAAVHTIAEEPASPQARPGCERNNECVAPAHAGAPHTEQDTTRRQQRPTVLRSSTDQCKYCGSGAHLSRHCPSK